MPASVASPSQSPFAPGENFAARYCRWRGLERSAYTEAVLAETLHPHARLLRPWLPQHCFILDRVFVENIGRLHRRREFNNLMLDFTQDPDSHGWLRDTLHLRLSVRRLHALVWQVFALPADQLDSNPSQPEKSVRWGSQSLTSPPVET